MVICLTGRFSQLASSVSSLGNRTQLHFDLLLLLCNAFFFLVNFLLLCILLGVIQALSFFLYGLEVEHSISIFFRVLFHAYIFLTYTLDQKFTVVTSYLLNRTQKT